VDDGRISSPPSLRDYCVKLLRRFRRTGVNPVRTKNTTLFGQLCRSLDRGGGQNTSRRRVRLHPTDGRTTENKGVVAALRLACVRHIVDSINTCSPRHVTSLGPTLLKIAVHSRIFRGASSPYFNATRSVKTS